MNKVLLNFDLYDVTILSLLCQSICQSEIKVTLCVFLLKLNFDYVGLKYESTVFFFFFHSAFTVSLN